MASFKRFGGTNRSANNEITKSFISNTDTININASSGQNKTKTVFSSHVDLDKNTILNAAYACVYML